MSAVNPVTVFRTPAETALIERFAAVRDTLPGAAAERAAAFARFETTGLPSRRVESYHYTDLRRLMKAATDRFNEWEHPRGHAPELAGFAHLTINNGRRWNETSPWKTTITELADELAAGTVAVGRAMGSASDTVVDLNTVFSRNGLVIRVAANASAKLHLAFYNGDHSSDGLPFDPDMERAHRDRTVYNAGYRVIVEVGANADVTLVETHAGQDGVTYQKNFVTEVIVGERAKVQHIRINQEGDRALALTTLAATVAANAELMTLDVALGAAVSRHQTFVTFTGGNGTLDVRGATMISGTQHADHTLVVDHPVPDCVSRETFKHAIDGEATGVFQGKIVVRREAQKTDGQMASHAVLLGDEATMNNKPELEIFADDVKCAHGATAGALDENLLFYLQARGLPKAEAEALMLQAFLGEAFDPVTDDGLSAHLHGLVADWLKGRGR